jgi:hypothetical protein
MSDFDPFSDTIVLISPETAWTAKGIAGRGVLVDYASWAKQKNISYEKFARHGISLDDIQAIAQMQNLDFRPGDVLFLRTGYVEAYRCLTPDRRKEVAALKEWVGLAQGRETTQWLWDRQFAAVASDSPGFECRRKLSSPRDFCFPSS